MSRPLVLFLRAEIVLGYLVVVLVFPAIAVFAWMTTPTWKAVFITSLLAFGAVVVFCFAPPWPALGEEPTPLERED